MGQIRWKWVLKTVGIFLGLIIVVGILIYIYFSFSFRPSVAPVIKVTPEKLKSIKTENLKKMKVPEPGEKVSENIAVPKEAVKANPQTESKFRAFELKGENGQLLPNEFRAYQNDIINIKLTAIDQDYDFRLESYNVQAKAHKGETKTIEFQALNVGIFNFYCSLCQTKNNPAGKVVVVPK